MGRRTPLTRKGNPTQDGVVDGLDFAWEFIEVPPFLEDRESLFGGDPAFREFQLALMENPEKWDVCKGTGCLRKARWGDKKSGKGKSGGIRIIYLQVPEVRVIVLLHGFPKSAQENLTDAEAEFLGREAERLRKAILAKRKPKEKGLGR